MSDLPNACRIAATEWNPSKGLQDPFSNHANRKHLRGLVPLTISRSFLYRDTPSCSLKTSFPSVTDQRQNTVRFIRWNSNAPQALSWRHLSAQAISGEATEETSESVFTTPERLPATGSSYKSRIEEVILRASSTKSDCWVVYVTSSSPNSPPLQEEQEIICLQCLMVLVRQV